MEDAFSQTQFGDAGRCTLELLAAALVADAQEEAGLPHIVVSRNVSWDLCDHHGPYETAVEAMGAADMIKSELSNEFAGETYTVSVYPLRAWPVPAHVPAASGQPQTSS